MTVITAELVLFITASFTSYVTIDALSCISCISSVADGSSQYGECYSSPGNIDNTVRCAHERFYCQSMFVFYDSGASVVQRGCADPYNDQDLSTEKMPENNRCTVTASAGSRRKETKCIYPCKNDYCNNVTMVELKKCAGDCSAPLGNGQCDYASGKCSCESGWGGKNCEISIGSTLPFRKCVQCNEKTDRLCRSSKKVTSCPGNVNAYRYCAVTRTTIFDQNQNELSSFISRGCSATYSNADECYFSPLSPDPNQPDMVEYTCTSSCDHDGCNTHLPDGLITGSEKKDLECLVCESDSDTSDCALGNLPRSRCPSSSHFCKSVVTYFIADKNDLRYKAAPEYKFQRISRKCARHAVNSRCKSHHLGGFHATKVKCEETCKTDGCNLGWPTRPLCSQCRSNYTSDGYDSCWSSPDEPKQCPKPYESYCVTMDSQLKNQQSQDGYKRFIQRGCSYYDVGATCSDVTFGEVEVQKCNRTCSTTGCNLGANQASAVSINFCIILLSFAAQQLVDATR